WRHRATWTASKRRAGLRGCARQHGTKIRTRTLRNNRNRVQRGGARLTRSRVTLPNRTLAKKETKTKSKRERQSRRSKIQKTKAAFPAAGTARRPLHAHGIKKKESKEPKDKRSRKASGNSAHSATSSKKRKVRRKKQADMTHQNQISGLPDISQTRKRAMIHHPNPATWIPPVIRFIEAYLPVLDRKGEEWDHMFTTAYQFGCDALIALGQAEETGRGARPLAHPRLPDVLTRGDDICVTVLSLAHQRGLLSYRLPDGRESPGGAEWWGRRGGEAMPPPNIMTSRGLGRAWAAPEVLPVLCALGLVRSGQWTAAAEPVLWREEPREWRLDIAADPRFQLALDRAVNKMPDDIR